MKDENDYDADAPGPGESDEWHAPPGTTTYRVTFVHGLTADGAAKAYTRYDGPDAWDCQRGHDGWHFFAYVTVPDHLADALREQLEQDPDVYGFHREDAP